jgi:hypothetical protein
MLNLSQALKAYDAFALPSRDGSQIPCISPGDVQRHHSYGGEPISRAGPPSLILTFNQTLCDPIERTKHIQLV